MAAYLKSAHHEIVVTPKTLAGVLPDVIRHLESFDALLVRSSALNFILAREAVQFVPTVLSGEGGDELFAGYDNLRALEPDALGDELIALTDALPGTALQRVDRCAAAHGLLVHLGFLDPDVVDYAFRIAPDLKIRGGVEKWILREAVAGLLPEAIRRRPKAKFWDGAGLREVLRREAELRAAEEDQKLMEDIRGRIALLVNTGESARYELIKADAEMLSAQNRAKSAHFRVTQAKAALRQFVGSQLPVEFSLLGTLPTSLAVAPLPRLREEILERNPELARSRQEAEQAEAKLSLERNLRTPAVALKATRDNDPDVRNDKIGVVVTIPLWDRRSGPVAEAGAQARRARYALEQQRFTLLQSLEGAYHQYEIATSQVAALEAGIVRQAENALKVAEAAYRYGERGILDYLDAQRVYRAARNELITARFELAAAVVELDRLRTASLLSPSATPAPAAAPATSPLPATSGH
jgi:hypothetical protein